jgi:hypothetical protein
MSEIIERLTSLLCNILETDVGKKRLINEFQKLVWDKKNAIPDLSLRQVFSELAYDLDFYEPNNTSRKEDPSYYGDDRLEKEILGALNKLKEASKG